MPYASILLLAGAASTDCLIIGFNYGVKNVRIGRVSNIFMAVVCFAGTLLSMLAGRLVGGVLQPFWGELAGGALFVLLGLYMLKNALCPKPVKRQHYSENPDIVDKDQSKVIELRESLLIGLLLCVNNVGIGIGGGMAGIPIWSASAACAVFSVVFITLGCYLGGKVENPKLARWLEALSALLILYLGAKELAGLLL